MYYLPNVGFTSVRHGKLSSGRYYRDQVGPILHVCLDILVESQGQEA